MPVLALDGAAVLTLDPTGYGTAGVSRVSLSLWRGTNTLELATNVVEYATAPTLPTNEWSTILFRRVSDGAWKGAEISAQLAASSDVDVSDRPTFAQTTNIVTNAIADYVPTDAILGQGETDLGTGLTLTIGSETACYTASPTGTWSLAVSAGALRYPRDLLIISTNGSVLPGYILDLRSGPAAATNLWYLRPFGTSTNWSLH